MQTRRIHLIVRKWSAAPTPNSETCSSCWSSEEPGESYRKIPHSESSQKALIHTCNRKREERNLIEENIHQDVKKYPHIVWRCLQRFFPLSTKRRKYLFPSPPLPNIFTLFFLPTFNNLEMSIRCLERKQRRYLNANGIFLTPFSAAHSRDSGERDGKRRGREKKKKRSRFLYLFTRLSFFFLTTIHGWEMSIK